DLGVDSDRLELLLDDLVVESPAREVGREDVDGQWLPVSLANVAVAHDPAGVVEDLPRLIRVVLDARYVRVVEGRIAGYSCPRLLGVPEQDRLDDGVAVDRAGDRLAHRQLGGRRLGAVEAD